jgi:hypothetical protein
MIASCRHKLTTLLSRARSQPGKLNYYPASASCQERISNQTVALLATICIIGWRQRQLSSCRH